MSELPQPPQSVETEQAVLGAMMISPQGIRGALEYLSPESFYHAAHGKIFQCIIEMHQKTEIVDTLTLTDALKKKDELELVGGVVYITSLSGEVKTAANISHHARIVQEKAVARQLIAETSEATSKAFGQHEPTVDLLDSTIGNLRSLRDAFAISGSFTNTGDMLEDINKFMDEARTSTRVFLGLETGLEDLNSNLNGLIAGDLYVFGARPSIGKTALATQIAAHVAAIEKKGVAIFSLEMSKIQIGLRLLSQSGGINLHHLRRPKSLTEDEDKHLTMAQAEVSKYPMFIDDSAGLSGEEIMARSEKLTQQHDIGLIAVDYLQLMGGKAQSDLERVGQNCRALKNMAKELNVPVILCSQLSRACESRPDHKPQLSDLRSTGDIEQDADTVILLHRPGFYGQTDPDGGVDSSATLIIAKQRNGPTRDVNVQWEGEFTRFVNSGY